VPKGGEERIAGRGLLNVFQPSVRVEKTPEKMVLQPVPALSVWKLANSKEAKKKMQKRKGLSLDYALYVDWASLNLSGKTQETKRLSHRYRIEVAHRFQAISDIPTRGFKCKLPLSHTKNPEKRMQDIERLGTILSMILRDLVTFYSKSYSSKR